MQHTTLANRPINRIGHVLARIKKVWHYYPALTLPELVFEIVLAANEAESAFPTTSIRDIEDIPYPERHYLHESRSLEMGIAELEKRHANKTLPPVPIQTALLSKSGDAWRKKPQMRLGQILSNNQLMAELEAET